MTPYILFHITRRFSRDEVTGEEIVRVFYSPITDARYSGCAWVIQAEDASSALEVGKSYFPNFPPGFLAVEPFADFEKRKRINYLVRNDHV